MESTQDTSPIALKPDTAEIGTKRKVGRPGVTYDQISSAAFAIRAGGRSVTAMAVREHLGTGSWGTIQPAVRRWNDENKPKVMLASPTLPDGLLREIGRELDRIAAEAKLEIKQDLQDAQDTADKYADLVRSYEVEQEALTDRVELLTVECDQAMALATERQQKIEQLVGSLAREQSAAEQTRVELAKARLQVEAGAVRLQDQADEMGRLRVELATEGAGRRKSETELAEAKAQVAAEREARKEAAKREADALTREREASAKAEASRAAADAAKSEADKRVFEAKADFDRQATEYKTKVAGLEKELATERDKTIASEAVVAMLKTQIEDLKTRLSHAETRLENALETYQSIAAKAVLADGQIVLPKKKSGTGSGAQIADRQT